MRDLHWIGWAIGWVSQLHAQQESPVYLHPSEELSLFPGVYDGTTTARIDGDSLR